MKHPKRRNTTSISIVSWRDTGFHSTLDRKPLGEGVAIYTKNYLSVFERDDLKVMDVNLWRWYGLKLKLKRVRILYAASYLRHN